MHLKQDEYAGKIVCKHRQENIEGGYLTCRGDLSMSFYVCCDLYKTLSRQNRDIPPIHPAGEFPHFSSLACFMDKSKGIPQLPSHCNIPPFLISISDVNAKPFFSSRNCPIKTQIAILFWDWNVNRLPALSRFYVHKNYVESCNITPGTCSIGMPELTRTIL